LDWCNQKANIKTFRFHKVAKFSCHAKEDPSIRRKHINAFINSRTKICPFYRKFGYAVF